MLLLFFSFFGCRCCRCHRHFCCSGNWHKYPYVHCSYMHIRTGTVSLPLRARVTTQQKTRTHEPRSQFTFESFQVYHFAYDSLYWLLLNVLRCMRDFRMAHTSYNLFEPLSSWSLHTYNSAERCKTLFIVNSHFMLAEMRYTNIHGIIRFFHSLFRRYNTRRGPHRMVYADAVSKFACHHDWDICAKLPLKHIQIYNMLSVVSSLTPIAMQPNRHASMFVIVNGRTSPFRQSYYRLELSTQWPVSGWESDFNTILRTFTQKSHTHWRWLHNRFTMGATLN